MPFIWAMRPVSICYSSFVCPAFFVPFNFFNVTGCTRCFLAIVLSYIFVFSRPYVIVRELVVLLLQPCLSVVIVFLACNPSQGCYITLCFYFIFLLFALPSSSSLLRLYLFGLFIHLHICRTVPAPSVPLGPFLFCLSYSKYVCLLLLFLSRYPQCSCLSCRLSSSRRVGRQCFFPCYRNGLENWWVCLFVCYFRVTPVLFYPFILLFCIFTDLLFLYILFCLFFSFQFSSSLRWHSLRET